MSVSNGFSNDCSFMLIQLAMHNMSVKATLCSNEPKPRSHCILRTVRVSIQFANLSSLSLGHVFTVEDNMKFKGLTLCVFS